MSVDCHVYLPAPARVDDVAEVLGLLFGCPMVAEQRKNFLYEYVPGARVVVCPEIVTMVSIYVEPPNTARARHWFYHFEGDALGRHLLSQRARPSSIAAGVALVDFFGGVVDMNDCDDEHNDYSAPAREDIHAVSDPEYHNLRHRMREVQPLTKQDLDQYRARAAYEE